MGNGFITENCIRVLRELVGRMRSGVITVTARMMIWLRTTRYVASAPTHATSPLLVRMVGDEI